MIYYMNKRGYYLESTLLNRLIWKTDEIPYLKIFQHHFVCSWARTIWKYSTSQISDKNLKTSGWLHFCRFPYLWEAISKRNDLSILQRYFVRSQEAKMNLWSTKYGTRRSLIEDCRGITWQRRPIDR